MNDTIEVKRFYNISSGNQLTGNTNSFSVILQIPDMEKFDRVTLIQANIPLSYYLVQSGYNTFVLDENGSSVTITVPVGNYNIYSFCAVVAPLLTSNSPNGYTYTMTYSNDYSTVNTGKITYTVSTTASPISFTFSNALNEQFGFDTNSTATFTPGVSTSTMDSSNVVKFIAEDTIYIHSNLVYSPDNGQASDVLAGIFYNNTVPFSNMTFLNPQPIQTAKYLTNGLSKSVNFHITNENNTPIYLNGLNVTFEIMLFKSEDYFKGSKKYLQEKLNRDVEQSTWNEQMLEKMNELIAKIGDIRIPESVPTQTVPEQGGDFQGAIGGPASLVDLGAIQNEPISGKPSNEPKNISNSKITTEPF